MPTCPGCNAENAAGRKFCGECGTPLARSCPSCGSPNEPSVHFCGECGVSLEGKADAPAQARAAERRLVSVLFADLVGFTTLSEGRDSEEVRELLSRYFDVCRRLVARYGGTVEKFIGDAVMAVWGTPVAREDDAERAVRAGLELIGAVAQLGVEVGADELRLRVGVVTGEAAVTVGAEGQGMVAGDLVNTAARVQSVAEAGTLLVNETTKRATDAAIAYEPHGAHPLKGKAEAVELYRATHVTASRGGALRSAGLEPPFVGRERELRLVKDLFHSAVDQHASHLVTVIGIAGIGKSRLAWEFEKYADGVADDIWWHRGRCLAYGDGVAYWALAEMVRMRARIAEEDAPADASAKLRTMLTETIADNDEREWLEQRLAQLIALGQGETFERQDLFSAWRLFFERLSEQGAVALVFEDLQWADASLLDFIEHLLDWSRTHPIYVLALARPELTDRRPGWGAAGRSSTTLSLDPLSDRSMRELMEGFVPGLPEELGAQILERAQGVPLYAVETVRMLLDRGLLAQEGDGYRVTGSVEALEVPETLHALVAARIDDLGPDERRLVQDAAVLGKSFTRTGLTALTGLPEAELEPILGSLIRKEVLSVQADPRSPERGQYSFLQDLLQRVAYETLSRGDRKARHLSAARYLEEVFGATDSEAIGVVAAHYLDAYRAAPEAEDASEIRAKAREMLVRAGRRAAALGASAEAERYFLQAAELTEGTLARAELHEEAGRAAQMGGRNDAAVSAFEQAIELYTSEGATHRAASVTGLLGVSMWFHGNLTGAAERLESALAVLADDEPDADLAGLIATYARLKFFLGDVDEAAERIERALEIAESLVLPSILVDALNTKHLVLGTRGRQEEALALLEHAIALGRELPPGRGLSRAIYNLSYQMTALDRFVDARQLDLEGVELARRRGDRVEESLNLGHLAANHMLLGEWDEALEVLRESSVTGRTSGGRSLVSFIAAYRGDVELARSELDILAGQVDNAEVQMRMGLLHTNGIVLNAEGHPAEALAKTREAVELGLANGFSWRHPFVKWSHACALDSAVMLNDLATASELLAEYAHTRPVDHSPLLDAWDAHYRGRLHGLEGDQEAAKRSLRAALEAFRALALPFEQGRTLLELGYVLAAGGRSGDAETALAEAAAIFERLGAKPWLDRVAAAGRSPVGAARA
ncbi:MAG TPA: adenylate/guanylate cyclase domain-containing protein [Gaiellaceae bacterium]|nr:adenylate/guanylate cyclase domain-containing protein [Gaiellaceae bacterium]